jgi:uncharacterized membrane protein
MPNVVVLTFQNMEEAGQVRESLRKLEKQGVLSLDDAAVVVKDKNGKVQVKGEMDRGVKVGMVGGGLLGLLLAGIFFPVGGLILGVLAGAGVGASTGLGIDKKFVKQVQEDLKPGMSALFVYSRHADPNAVVAVLKPYSGHVYQSSLSPEDEATLRRILEDQPADDRWPLDQPAKDEPAPDQPSQQ